MLFFLFVFVLVDFDHKILFVWVSICNICAHEIARHLMVFMIVSLNGDLMVNVFVCALLNAYALLDNECFHIDWIVCVLWSVVREIDSIEFSDG